MLNFSQRLLDFLPERLSFFLGFESYSPPLGVRLNGVPRQAGNDE